MRRAALAKSGITLHLDGHQSFLESTHGPPERTRARGPARYRGRFRAEDIALNPYPIGTPGVAWGAPERALWLAQQRKLRSFTDDIVTRIERLAGRFDVEEYGRLDYPPDHYRLLALRSREPRDDRPWVLVTGGVHGYETSGAHG